MSLHAEETVSFGIELPEPISEAAVVSETPSAQHPAPTVGPAPTEQDAPQSDQPPTLVLGSFGAEDFESQHALRPARDLHARVDAYPRVLLAILAKQKERPLPLYLNCIEGLDYPKSAIFLYVRTNNNTDRTEQILREWVERVGPSYAGVEFDADPVAEPVEQVPPHEWNSTRFRVLGQIRNVSLQKTLEHGCDFYFVCDSDNFIRSCTLKELVALNLPIVAPFLRVTNPTHGYSNFFAKTDAAGFFAGCDEYQWITRRWVRGVVEVPVVHCTYLVRSDVIPELHYLDGSDDWEFAVFCKSAREAGIPQYLDNRQMYGYITFDPESNATKVNVAGGASDQIGFAQAELENVDGAMSEARSESVGDRADPLRGGARRCAAAALSAAEMPPATRVTMKRTAPSVFIHAAPRTASTWFWSKFREHPATLCFCEPFGPHLGWITRESALTWDRASWQSRHSPTEPYYQEYFPLVQEFGAVTLFDPAMELEWFIPLGGLRGELRQGEQNYLSLLLEHADDAGRVPVLKFIQSLGRLWAIRNSFGGFHVFLHRNLWRQWLSYLYYGRRGMHYFYETTARVVARSEDSFLSSMANFYVKRALDFRLRRDEDENQPPSDDERLHLLRSLPEAHAFAMFMALHIHLYLHAQLSADLTVDITKLARDSGYRSHIETELAQRTGLEVSLSDVIDEQGASGVAIGAGRIDWDEIRKHARLAVETLSEFGDPTKLMENATEFIDSAIEEMHKSEAAPAMQSDAAEEIWYARLQEARCHWALGDEGGFLRQALALVNERPDRAEPLFDLARFHRERGMHETAAHFAETGLAIGRPRDDDKFVDEFVYQSGLQQELAIAAFYCRDPARKERGAAACNWLAVNPDIPASTREWARENLSFYSGLAEERSSRKLLPIYVISLDRTPDRLAEFYRRNAHLHHVERFPAVDGRTLDREKLISEGVITGDCIYTAGALGNALSHFALWRRAVEEGRAITVAEDDAIFSRNFAARSKEFLEHLPEDWDFVQWGWVFTHRVWADWMPQVAWVTMIFDQDQLRRQINEFQAYDAAPAPIRLRHSFGTVCYSVSPKGARALLEHCMPLNGKRIEFPGCDNLALDCMMNGAYPSLKAFISMPPLVFTEHREEETTVREGGVDRWPPVALSQAVGDGTEARERLPEPNSDAAEGIVGDSRHDQLAAAGEELAKASDLASDGIKPDRDQHLAPPSEMVVSDSRQPAGAVGIGAEPITDHMVPALTTLPRGLQQERCVIPSKGHALKIDARAKLINDLWRGIDPFTGFPRRLIGIDTQGWSSDHPYLRDTIARHRPQTIVEVGVWKGGSVITMAKQIQASGIDGVIIAVDTWLGSSEHWLEPDWFAGMSCQFGQPQTYHKFLANVIESGIEKYVIPFPLDFINAASVLAKRGVCIDLIHLDGGHHYDAVTTDLNAWWPLLNHGGIFIGDDYIREWPEVKSAIDDFLSHTPHADFEVSFPKCRARKI